VNVNLNATMNVLLNTPSTSPWWLPVGVRKDADAISNAAGIHTSSVQVQVQVKVDVV
jgi:hypothetical protein